MMPNYQECMRRATQGSLLESVKAVDARADAGLIADYISYRALPTPEQLDAICGSLNCGVLELYTRDEVDLLKDAPIAPAKRKSRGGTSHGENVYNLTVELDRTVAERTLSDESLRLLGYRDKSDFIRKAVARADARLRYLKRKAALGADTPQSDG